VERGRLRRPVPGGVPFRRDQAVAGQRRRTGQERDRLGILVHAVMPIIRMPGQHRAHETRALPRPPRVRLGVTPHPFRPHVHAVIVAPDRAASSQARSAATWHDPGRQIKRSPEHSGGGGQAVGRAGRAGNPSPRPGRSRRPARVSRSCPGQPAAEPADGGHTTARSASR
jgi:hypothetical protein